MSTTKSTSDKGLPRNFDELVAIMPPQAIQDDVQYENTLEMVDRLMAMPKLSRGQSLYLETLVQLTEAYEREHHAIDVSDIGGLESLQHLLNENAMSACELARLLGIHASMGSKILRGERSLTLQHVRKLCDHFKVDPRLFID